jgi:hypothetical protein
LTPAARALAQQASVVPDQIERSLLEELHGPGAIAIDGSLDECLERGVLIGDRESLRFRHDLARVCIEQSLSLERRSELHAQVFAALGRRVDAAALLARRVHHAEQAGLVDAASTSHSPRARQAASQRDAAALRPGAYMRSDLRLRRWPILEARVECALIRTRRRAAARDSARITRAATGVHRMESFAAGHAAYQAKRSTMRKAVELLEQMPAGRELAWASADMAAC